MSEPCPYCGFEKDHGPDYCAALAHCPKCEHDDFCCNCPMSSWRATKEQKEACERKSCPPCIEKGTP